MGTGHNIVTVMFAEEDKAIDALEALRRADRAGRIVVRSAAVLERRHDGELQVPGRADGVLGTGIAEGSLLRVLVRVLGSPLGVLLGWGPGAPVGKPSAVRGAECGDEALRRIGAALPIGTTGLVAEVFEYAVEVLEGEMAELGGTVIRCPAAEVLDELEAAEAAAEAAEAEGDRVIREGPGATEKRQVEDPEATWDDRVRGLERKLGV